MEMMTRWDPFRDLETTRNRLAVLFGPLARAKELAREHDRRRAHPAEG